MKVVLIFGTNEVELNMNMNDTENVYKWLDMGMTPKVLFPEYEEDRNV